jgi:dTDP-4-amino-4,6-dideoxygalactose transaminase
MANYEEVKKPDSYPYPARMSNIQAKIGVSQIESLAENIQHRNDIFSKYREIFGDFKLTNTSSAPLRFVLEVRNRDEWIESLSPVLQVETWFDSCAQGKRNNLWEIEYTDGECPVAEKVESRIINLPTHLKVRPKDVSKIKQKLSKSLWDGIIS